MLKKSWLYGGIGALLAAVLVVAGISSASAADPVLTRAAFSTSTNWTWVNDASLGNTSGADQYAQATISGTFDKDHAAGFRLRYGSAASNVLLAVSGTEWKTEPAGNAVLNGPKALTAPGVLRVEIGADNAARIFWNGALIGARMIPGAYAGTGIVPSIWQSSPGLKMTNIEAGSLSAGPAPTSSPSVTATVTVTPTVTASPVTSTAPAVTVTPGVPTATVTAPAVTVTPTVVVTPTVTVTPTSAPTSTTTTAPTSPTSPSVTSESTPPTSTSTTPPPTATGAATWLSGASSVYAANGTFGTWRGEPVRIVGTWSDSKDCSATVCSFSTSGDMANVKGTSISLDIAVGAIWSGQSWSQAATGAYNGQWQQTLTALKNMIAAKGMDPSKVYIRFAHEMNGNWTDWRVASGQEADFRAAIARFSSLRYSTFGDTNAPKLVLCANDGTSGGMANPRNLMVKTDGLNRKVVDVYCIDTYNQYPHRTDAAAVWSALNNTSDATSIESHRSFAEAQGVPFSVGEWSNCGIPTSAGSDCSGGGGGESPAYVEQMNRYFRTHAGTGAGDLLYEVQFNLWPRFAFYGSDANQPQTSARYAALVWGQ